MALEDEAAAKKAASLRAKKDTDGTLMVMRGGPVDGVYYRCYRQVSRGGWDTFTIVGALYRRPDDCSPYKQTSDTINKGRSNLPHMDYVGMVEVQP